MTTRRGFTLIEILVVVSIIAFLAAILFPVFTRVREKGRQTSCLSNLRQLGHAMTMYTQDYERYPHAIDPADRFAAEIWENNPVVNGIVLKDVDMLTDVMEPYVKNDQLWRCPSDTGFDSPDSIPYQLEKEATKPSCFVKYGTSYFYRTELMFRNLAEDNLNEPTKINVLFDAHGEWHGSNFLGRSDRRYNVLFADGHVKGLNGEQMDAAWFTPVQ
jgi:general secretion pathway protein G